MSVAKKTWQESQKDCAERSARLLVRDDWSSLLVPVQSRGVVVPQEGGAGQSPAGPAAALSVEVAGWHHEPRVPILAGWGEKHNQPRGSWAPGKCWP